MEEKTEYITCPFCGNKFKKGNPHHTPVCLNKYLNNLTDDEKNKIIHLYNVEEYSMVDMSKYLNLPYQITEKVLSYIGLKRRTVKDATSKKKCRDKYKKTCLEHFGTEHNFSKNSPSRQKWEKRLFDEEGIVNVFQRTDVKEKIKKTMLEKYGEDGIFENRRKGNFVEYYIEKYGEEEGIKYFQWVKERKTAVNKKEYYIEKYKENWQTEWDKHLDKLSAGFRHNAGLNDTCEQLLIKNNIEYTREYPLHSTEHRYSYDFKIGNILLELNGIYWHCSPKKYKPNDMVLFPNNVFIKAKDKWAYDETKMAFAKEMGYIPVTIWEDEFNETTLIEQINKIKNENV